MLNAKNPVAMPIVKEIHKQEFLKQILNLGLHIAAGFPLFLIGGSETYSDIDVYANNWEQYMQGFQLLADSGELVSETPYSRTFDVDGYKFQLIQPGTRSYTGIELISATDMTPSACLLLYENNEFVVLVMYPEDIHRRICRVLEKHDWTEFRKNVYRNKGYTIVDTK